MTRTIPAVLALAVLLLAASAARALGPFILFFPAGGASLQAEHEAVLDNAARAFRDLDARRVEVAGFADRTGSAAANLRLSRRRAEAVKAALVARGYPTEAIVIKALGEERPLVETADGIPEAQNRFVTITMTMICRGEAIGMSPDRGC